MNEVEQRALVEAAFHAWVTLGDVITEGKGLPRGLKQQCIVGYDLLTRALPPTARGDGAPQQTDGGACAG